MNAITFILYLECFHARRFLLHTIESLVGSEFGCNVFLEHVAQIQCDLADCLQRKRYRVVEICQGETRDRQLKVDYLRRGR